MQKYLVGFIALLIGASFFYFISHKLEKGNQRNGEAVGLLNYTILA